ncbi:RNA polymerase factor sigma-54 [Bacillus methanolicus PB1]|uniref:RNA polymerase factor sigma-54 n=1 Tax=Bacillus methanolicus PB1 TaxID=997296 RepID=I3E281_BACMT|nr:RNA polymerase factor sigma-54 [Bacillus methanolicus]EIJ80602.1 RNA polymerase factor sigma-54 [Bacillus methanolicus PB1]
MNLQAGLWQQQTMKLTLTQELAQAIALLQYSAYELSAFLESKAMENPLIQIEDNNIRSIDPRVDKWNPKRKKIDKDEKNWIEQIGENVVTLDEILFSQLNMKEVAPSQKKVISYLIQCIDENGYLRADLEEVSVRFQISSEEVQFCVNLLQELEPYGIGARSLRECLLIQLRKKEQRDLLAEKIVDEYFLMFTDKKWKDLAKKLEVDINDIQRVFDCLQSLNPRPGAIFHYEKPAYVIPDVIIGREGHKFTVKVFDDAMPKVRFNEKYYKKMFAYKNPEVSRFLQEKQQDYQWIMKSLEQRKETLIKVALKITERQQDFFRKGPQFLKPMTMRDLSDELGIHESTVSRAVRGKFVQTPYGTLELKSFFTSTVQSVSNENTSSNQVKNLISQYIEEENKQNPLSDQEITRMLENREGIIVSRRTVAKYRDQLGIPSSTKRKRYE